MNKRLGTLIASVILLVTANVGRATTPQPIPSLGPNGVSHSGKSCVLAPDPCLSHAHGRLKRCPPPTALQN